MTATTSPPIATRPLDVYVPRLVVGWLQDRPQDSYCAVEGTMAFVDISGFTKLTERLARKGRVGAEEMSDILNVTFGALLTVARADGAELLKWGGDAVLLLFDGPDHPSRAARSAVRMRRALRDLNHQPTSSAGVVLRMSVGIHSGQFHLFLVGDPQIHRELIVSGPTASITAEMEAVAEAGQIAVSDASAALLAPRLLGAAVPGGRLLRGEPVLADLPMVPRGVSGIDVGQALPPQVRRHLRAASGESEHRPISVAFVQFSGTDALLREQGPAALADALDECIRNVQHATMAHEVTFFESDINRDGGKIMLTAGAPRSSGHDEERMLRAARQIVDRAGVLPLRVGVNRGYVFAGDFGPDFRRTYSVKGDAINLAARVMGKAVAGQVLATRATIARSRTLFRNEPLEPFMVKGKSEPVLAVSVGEVIGEQAGDEPETPLYGRSAELATMVEAIAAARAGHATFVDLVGEPGIGKSRFVSELRSLADGLRVVEGPSGTYESATAYFPFQALLRAALGVRTDAGEELVRDRLVARVTADAPELLLWLPLIAIPLGIELPATSETSELDEEFRKAKLEEVTLEVLRLLLPTASLLVFENAQLMDDASKDLLHRVESECDNQPWLVVVARRDQATGFAPLGTAPGFRRMELGPIDDAAAIEVLLAATHRSPLTRQTVAALAERAGGNPLFLNALALVAGQTGALAQLPESVDDIVTSQIDRLEPQDRTLLRYAAVLGMRFEADTLRQMLSDRTDVLTARSLERLEVFLHAGRDGTLEFRHGVIRDVAYAGLPYRLRREMHDRVGTALEAGLVDPEAEAELLSLHFFHAGRFDKAWPYSRTAGGHARSRYAYVAAGEFLERAIDSARRTTGVAPPEISAVQEELGDVRALLGRSLEAIDSYRAARSAVRLDAVAAGRLIFKEAVIEQRLGRFTRSLTLLSRGLQLLDGVQGSVAAAERTRLTTRYGFGRYLQGRSREAVRWCERATELAQLTDDQAALAMAYNALQLAYMQSGRIGDSSYGTIAMSAYEQLGDLSGQGHCANNLAIAAHQDGRWAEAEEMFGRAAETFARIGDVANESNALYNRGDLLIRQGRFAEAEPLLVDVARTARAVADAELVALALREHARASSGLGKLDEAEALFDEARTGFDRLGLGHEIPLLEAARAEGLLRSRGRASEAFVLLESAWTNAVDRGIVELLPMVHRLRALAYAQLGRLDEAVVEVERGLLILVDRDGGYEHALLLLAATHISDLGRSTVSAPPDEARGLLRRLGVEPSADPFGMLVTSG